MLKDNNIISKSKAIVDLKNLNLTLQEFKIMNVYLSRIDPRKEDSAIVQFTKKEYCELLGIKAENLKTKRLSKYMQHLFDNSVVEWLDENNERFRLHHLFENAEYDPTNSLITLECGHSNYIRQMFFDITKFGYIKYALKNTLYLKSVYSIRLYLYLLENRFRKDWNIDLKVLKEVLECNTEYYNSFQKFNQKILKTSVDEINTMTNISISYDTIRKARKVSEIKFICHFKDTNEVINGEFEEKDIPSISSNLTWNEIENDLEYGSLEYVIAEIQYTFKSMNKKEELSKAELNIIKELYDMYGGRMMVVASREASVYKKYSLYYMKELMKTWVMKGYSVEDVENGKR